MTTIQKRPQVNNRQYYTNFDTKKKLKVTYSIKADCVDKYEKTHKSIDTELKNEIDAKVKEKNLANKMGWFTRGGLALGGLTPILLSLKFIKGKKKYLIAPLTGFVGCIAGFFAGIALGTTCMLRKPLYNMTTQLNNLDKECGFKIDKVENMNN